MKNSPRLKVGLVFDDSLDSNDGVAQYVKQLGGWLSGQGHQVSYLVGQTKLEQWHGSPVYSLAKNITVRFNGNKLSMPLYSSKRKIKQLLAGNDFDILHVMVPYSPVMAQRVIKLAPSHTKIVGTFHILPSGKLSSLGSRLLKFGLSGSLRKFSETVSVSRVAAEFAKTAYKINSTVVPNPVNIEQFSKPNPQPNPSDSPQIVFLGRLVKRKGVEQLIEAFALLNKTLPDCQLVIAGSGPQLGQLKAKVGQLGLAGKVDFLGYIDEADKPALLRGADIACFPSLYGESFGIVLVEAMAAGSKLVLGGDNPGYRSVLGQQPLLLIDPKNTTAFAARLKKLLSDDVAEQRLHEWQLSTVAQYDINVVGAQIIDLYNRQIAPSPKKSDNKSHG